MKKLLGGLRRMLCVLLVLMLLGAAFYLGVVAMVCYRETHLPPVEDYDALIVLGAQVKPDGTLSLQLQWRLDAAVEAWQAHPCWVVTCGARGSNEPIEEAYAMRDYLIAQGVPAEWILTDPASYNTRQNIANAIDLLADKDVQRVAVVTSDYHVPRAMAIAEDAGLEACGIPAPTKLGMRFWLKNHGREGLAWIKYWAQKYLHLPLE
ncbi:MAG: YdcF family protein [Clostridia bacterium]|nr:YdcF family protein [Clostridia bacterium]